jgi:hypothetical protein
MTVIKEAAMPVLVEIGAIAFILAVIVAMNRKGKDS